MKKLFTFFGFLLATLLVINAKALMAPEGEEEQLDPSIELMLKSGEDAINLTNGNASVDFATAVEVSFDAIVPHEATYTLQTMKQVEGEESTSWEADQTIATGELSLSGKGYAEFETPIYFNQGERFVLTVVAKANGEVIATQTAEFNGSYVESMTTTTSLMLGEDEVAINDHSSVTVENADAIKVQVENEPSVIGFSYNINIMKAVEGEEGTTWVADESYDIAVGEGNFNGGTGYAQFNDGTINFEEGNKYQVKVTVYGGNPAEPAELAVYTYEINGAYAPVMTTTTSLMLGEDEVAINDHSAVTVENADAIKVQVENAPQAIGFTYLINEMVLNEGEEGIFWTVGEEIADGEGNFNGGMGYAQFNGGTIYFEEGKKYQVSVSVVDQELNEIDIKKYEIIGSYTDEAAAEIALIAGEEEIALNSHAEVSVETAEAITVNFGTATVKSATYTINSMIMVEGEESSSWEVNETIAKGELSINATGYAEFEEPIVFEQGTKYQVVVDIVNFDETEETVTCTINGAYAAPVVAEVALFAGEEQIVLNDHSSVSVEKMEAIKVTFGNPTDVKEANVAISAMLPVETEEGMTFVPGIPSVFGLSINTFGYAEKAYTFEQGTKYQIEVNVTFMDETTETATYTVDGAYVKEEPAVEIAVKGTEMQVIFPEGTDLGDNYAVKPYIMAGEEKIEVADYYTDSNDPDNWFAPLNIIKITLDAPLAKGNYTLVLPEGMFFVNGGDNNKEMTIDFTVENATAISGINAAASNGAIFNLAGARVNSNAKGIVIENGKKVLK